MKPKKRLGKVRIPNDQKSFDDWGRRPNGNPSRVAVAKSTSDYLTRVANEPSVGLYHVQDHIRRSIPKFVDIQVLAFFLPCVAAL
jgi:hypothetical protein